MAVGDLAGNKLRILDALRIAHSKSAHLVLFPELALLGYPPEDLLLKPGVIKDNLKVLQEVAVAAQACECRAIVGFANPGASDPVQKEHFSEEARWPGLYNSVGVLADGQVQHIVNKTHLPNYAVFDEHRYFAEGQPPKPLELNGSLIGIAICEDLWVHDAAVKNLKEQNVDLVLHLNASPYYSGKPQDRLKLLKQRAQEFGCPIVYVNLVGGQDELIFDGGSLVLSKEGQVLAQAAQFKEEILFWDTETNEASNLEPDLDISSEIYEALVLGTRDYVHKNGFKEALIGLSGGIDSSLVAAVAADALGPENVYGVSMPSRFSSQHSKQDASELAQNLGINFQEISIETAHKAFLKTLGSFLESGPGKDLAGENLQARIRGVILMALSNLYGRLVLTTGNKTESAVGYFTLYGDAVGAYAVIRDIWKEQVYALAHSRNQAAGRELIPQRVFEKPPSAELRPDQRDDQSLPPYEVLDPVVKALVEQDRTVADLLNNSDLEPEVVREVAGLLDKAEYKRKQLPPGPRVSSKAFGKDRRLPITNLYS